MGYGYNSRPGDAPHTPRVGAVNDWSAGWLTKVIYARRSTPAPSP